MKDAAADAATLAWVLSRYRIAPTAPLPAGVSRESIDAFRTALIERLVPLAAPRD